MSLKHDETCSHRWREKNMKHLLGSTATVSEFLHHVEVRLSTCSACRKSPGLNVCSKAPTGCSSQKQYNYILEFGGCVYSVAAIFWL